MDRTIVNGMRVMLINEYADLKVGQVYEVGNITDTHIIIRNPKSKVAVAGIDVGYFNKYFEPAQDKKSFTEWAALRIEDEVNGFYRTNGKKVIVKIGDTTASASCNKGDSFNLGIGLQLAYYRCLIKKGDSIIERLRIERKREIELKANIIRSKDILLKSLNK